MYLKCRDLYVPDTGEYTTQSNVLCSTGVLHERARFQVPYTCEMSVFPVTLLENGGSYYQFSANIMHSKI